MGIGGNITAVIQIKSEGKKNKIGERECEWDDAFTLRGWLDFSGGQNNYAPYNAKVQESTHIFICDFSPLQSVEQDVGLTSENGRMIIEENIYDILLIDDPMRMHEHLEIYLKYVGGGQGV